MTALALVALLVLIALNGFFVSAEFALVRTRRNKIEQMAEEGDRASKRVLKQLSRIDEYLSACQVGITMASIGIGFLGEPAIADLIEPLFEASCTGWPPRSFGIAFAIATSLHITVGEQVPKLMSISRAERTSRRVAATRLVQHADEAVHARAEQGLELDPAAVRHPPARARGSSPPRRT